MSLSNYPPGVTGNEPQIVGEDERPDPETMTDRDILIEILEKVRMVEDGLSTLENSPMIQAMMNGGNPLMAMMGRG